MVAEARSWLLTLNSKSGIREDTEWGIAIKISLPSTVTSSSKTPLLNVPQLSQVTPSAGDKVSKHVRL